MVHSPVRAKEKEREERKEREGGTTPTGRQAGHYLPFSSSCLPPAVVPHVSFFSFFPFFLSSRVAAGKRRGKWRTEKNIGPLNSFIIISVFHITKTRDYERCSGPKVASSVFISFLSLACGRTLLIWDLMSRQHRHGKVGKGRRRKRLWKKIADENKRMSKLLNFYQHFLNNLLSCILGSLVHATVFIFWAERWDHGYRRKKLLLWLQRLVWIPLHFQRSLIKEEKWREIQPDIALKPKFLLFSRVHHSIICLVNLSFSFLLNTRQMNAGWTRRKEGHRLRELGLKRSVMNHAPGRYLRLDLFIKVLSLLCPNLTDASSIIEAVLRLAHKCLVFFKEAREWDVASLRWRTRHRGPNLRDASSILMRLWG